jgi:DNA-binding transcriptional ArsR family regulator
MAESKYDLKTSRVVFEVFSEIAKYDDDPPSVKELSEYLSKTRAVVSEQIRTLKLNGLVNERVDGKNKYFSVNKTGLVKLVKPDNEKRFLNYYVWGLAISRTFKQFIEKSKTRHGVEKELMGRFKKIIRENPR